MDPHRNPKQRARAGIDATLIQSGWTVQSLTELNLHTSLGVAVREMQSQRGPADYGIFVQGKALGIVEAKKEGETLSLVAEQSARYSHARKWIPQTWADPLPFPYESTGVETNFRRLISATSATRIPARVPSLPSTVPSISSSWSSDPALSAGGFASFPS